MKETNPKKASVWCNGKCVSLGDDFPISAMNYDHYANPNVPPAPVPPNFIPMPSVDEIDQLIEDLKRQFGGETNELDENPPVPMIYHGNATPQLKCRCWRCDKEINPTSQFYDYGLSKYLITAQCHGQLENAKLTEKEIEKVNEQGFYYFFM